ncbi:glycoside hydrolase family 31 [Pelobium manganitolerans]|uniref:Glycoside hydrolase family 31 n=1 Tax=Pelobium manganitolerans TaxID=1842495 RepID=A0A419SBF1_9SPHI|nr:glycoside hydrolase family 31 protein [Pelobium manganitolerans]RKD20151.1 glycoside hydrolase family 31 [Pelobium manganitolerans]
MRKLYLLFLALPFFSNAQTNPVLSAGNITHVQIEKQQISFKTENAQGQIVVYSPNMLRVRLDKKELGRDFSYAVIAQPQTCNANIAQSEESITITTDSLRAIINKKPFSVAFYTLDGKVINEDERGLQNSWVGDEVTAYKHMQNGERFVGLGEKTGNLDRRGEGYTNWNTDAFGYATNRDPIYSTIPFYIGIHSGLNYGIFLDNTFQSDFNFGASNDRFSSFGAQGGELNYYFIYHKQLKDIIGTYTQLTGRMKMPPLWSLGYQQNRYSYYPDTEVMRIAQTLREKKIPADGITLDIHYMDKYKLFTWDKERFGNPQDMNKKLQDMGFKTTVIVDPGIKVEKGYEAWEEGVAKDLFIKYPDGTNYTGQVWPGWCNFPDFTNEKARAWWREKVKFFANTGVSGIWNDMNEISTWGQKMPSNILFNYDGALASNKQAHNVYGSLMARSSFEGMVKATNKRPFILTRAAYAGLQRYTAIWTGDNRSEDDHMLLGVRLLTSLGLSGVSFTGMDIGGFTGNPSVGLYAKWIQLGAFNPYFRNHTAVNTKSSEPWAYGEEVTEISRNYVSLRYKLLPYLYASFYTSVSNGLPVARSLAIDNTFDDKIYDTQFQNQFLFGDAFLVAPFESTKGFGNIYFPKGNWYNLYTGEKQAGNSEKIVRLSLQKMPVYVKESSIVPMQSLIQSTAEKPSDTLSIHIYKGNLNHTFVYYEDDGESYDYEKGAFYKRAISYDATNRKIVFGAVEGNYASKFKNLKLVFHGFDAQDKIKTAQALQDDFASFLTPISKFDPQGSANAVEGYKVKSVVISNNAKQFEIKY